MPRRNVERKTSSSSGYCKIRKRVSSSSSSSSSCYSLVKNHRLKRANSSTPWKMASLRSPAVDKGKEAQMSARRLAATLWDFSGGVVEQDKDNLKGTPTHPQSHTPLCKVLKEGSKQAKHRRRSSEKLHLIEFDGEAKDSSHQYGASAAKVTSHGGLDTGGSNSSRLKDVSTSLTASKELVKVLLKMWSHEEQNSSRLTLVSALRVEIDRARHQVEHLMHEKRYIQKEIDALLKQLASEKAAWKSREQERILNAVSSVSRELEAERKLRRQTETQGMIVDDEINATLVRPIPARVRLHAIIDACHSGTALDLPFLCRMNRSGQYGWEDHRPRSGAWTGSAGGEVISFSGCDDDQTSADTSALSKVTSTGAMTYCFIQAIERGQSATYGSMLNSMRSAIRSTGSGTSALGGGAVTSLLTMLVNGGSLGGGGLQQEPQLTACQPFDVYMKPFSL